MTKKLNIVVYTKKGCSYCEEVKQFLRANNHPFQIIDITDFDQYRDVLEAKYGVRHVPVVEIGYDNTYKAVTEVGIEYLQEALIKQVLLII